MNPFLKAVDDQKLRRLREKVLRRARKEAGLLPSREEWEFASYSTDPHVWARLGYTDIDEGR